MNKQLQPTLRTLALTLAVAFALPAIAAPAAALTDWPAPKSAIAKDAKL